MNKKVEKKEEKKMEMIFKKDVMEINKDKMEGKDKKFLEVIFEKKMEKVLMILLMLKIIVN